MKGLLLFCPITILLCWATYSTAQTTPDYVPLESQYPVPKNILSSTYKKSKKDIDENIEKDNESRRSRKQKTKFILEGNYILDNLIKSELVLFNTPLNRLIEGIADELLKDNLKFRKKLTFYVVKSSAVNAFATDRGDIFVTYGLLARLKNEAELAFILAHEIIHAREKHSMDVFAESMDMENGSKKKNSYDQLLFKSNYQKSIELEADKEGMVILEKSKYRLEAAIDIFNTLNLSHASVFDLPIDSSVFEFGYISVPDSLWLEDVAEIKPLDEVTDDEVHDHGDEDYTLETEHEHEDEPEHEHNHDEDDERWDFDDEEDEDEDEEDYAALGTHPDISERVATTGEQISSFETVERLDYVTTKKADFQALVLMAQMELAQVYLRETKYSNATYHAATMLKTYPDNKYLQKCFVYGIYGNAQYRQMDFYQDTEYVVQGNFQRFNHLLNEMPIKDLVTMAAVHTWELAKKYPNDDQLKLMAKDMLEDVIIYTIDDPKKYFLKAPLESDTIPDPDLYTMAFADYLDDPTFKKYVKLGKGFLKERLENEEKSRWQIRKERRKKIKKGHALGENRVIFIDPDYLDARVGLSQAKIDYKKSEEKKPMIKKLIKDMADDVNIKADILDFKGLKSEKKFTNLTDIHLIGKWMEEFNNHPGYMVSLYHNEAIELCQRKKTSHFASLGVIAVNNSGANTAEKLSLIFRGYGWPLLVLVLPETAPFGLYYLGKQRQEIYYYTNVVDMENYTKAMSEFNNMRMKATKSVIANHIHWTLSQIKRKPKK